MTAWPSTRAKRVLAALLRLEWSSERQANSQVVLRREDGPDCVFAFHDGEEIGPRMLAASAVASSRASMILLGVNTLCRRVTRVA